MTTKLFKFYPPKKEKNPYLLPNSDLLPNSVLAPLSKNAKKRKFDGAKNKNAAFGPVNAPAMASALAIIPGPSTGGYGASSYGALAYGEAEEKKRKAEEKALLEAKAKKDKKQSKYTVYGKYDNLFETSTKY
jgi:hypothetical protein